MPGRGSYGPGGKWIHDRAHRIMEEGKVNEKYGPDRGKQVAYAIATQQAHKLGKTPKVKGGYGTPTGRREAKTKFDQPRKAYQKTASGAGQDLRLPVLGGTKFPTMDSKALPMQRLRSSQKAAEVGPAPTPKKLRPKGPSMKLGSPMGTDPLVQYLQKRAEAGALEDNAEDMPLGRNVEEAASECPMPKGGVQYQPIRDREQLGGLFEHPSKEAKYLARMHPATSGSVDRVLQRH
jgi:hypothetical protein